MKKSTNKNKIPEWKTPLPPWELLGAIDTPVDLGEQNIRVRNIRSVKKEGKK